MRLVLGRNARLDLGGGDGALLAVQAGRHQQVYAVGVSVDVVVNPAQFDVEGLRGVTHATEHAESAGVADRRDYVTAVTEGEQREVDVEHRTDFVVHYPLTLLFHARGYPLALLFLEGSPPRAALFCEGLPPRAALFSEGLPPRAPRAMALLMAPLKVLFQLAHGGGEQHCIVCGG